MYGPTDAKADSLRSHKSGRLKTEMIDGQEFGVQVQRNGSTLCSGRPNVKYCFDRGRSSKTKKITKLEIIMIFKNVFLGDVRNNQHFGLILYEETFLRFHNYIAELLLKNNPKWEDEQVYQEARRFIIAVLQITVYRDYLPVLLGRFLFKGSPV